MALVTIEGIYKDGKVELTKRPTGVTDGARVQVTILPLEGPRAEADVQQSADEARREAGRRLLARLEQGIPFGGAPYPKREELYDRVKRFDRRDG